MGTWEGKFMADTIKSFEQGFVPVEEIELKPLPEETLDPHHLSPHTKVLEVSQQMSDLTESAGLIEAARIRAAREAHVWSVSAEGGHTNNERFLFGEHAEKPCKGCADKAEQMKRRIDLLTNELHDLRRLLVGVCADVERMKCPGLIAR